MYLLLEIILNDQLRVGNVPSKLYHNNQRKFRLMTLITIKEKY